MTTAYVNRIATGVPPHDIHAPFVTFAQSLFADERNLWLFQRMAERAGATTASSVSANTDMLITGADVGASKLTKAEKLEVEVVDQGEIWKLLIDAGVA